MPFIGKDWRSPGEKWIKTEDGWENSKILECQKSSEYEYYNIQPYYQLTIKGSKEIAGFNRFSDACKQLDFKNAVYDIRKFQYVCKLLDVLISQDITGLSGCGQKCLFIILESVANTGLLKQLKKTLDFPAYWGRLLGSAALWTDHKSTLTRIQKVPPKQSKPELQQLPEECFRSILLCLSDSEDLENVGKALPNLQLLIQESQLWKKLIRYHFGTISDQPSCSHTFRALKRKHGCLRIEFAEILLLCPYCRCLYWESKGHPCKNDKSVVLIQPRPVSPQVFVNFFSL